MEWIRIADPEAGRVDDLQIASAGRVDAYQVKWSRHPGSLSFRDLTTASGAAPSLIAQLADGWTRLRSAHPERHVVVHLVANDRPSVADRLPGTTNPGESRHLAAFLSQVWEPRSNGGIDPNTDVPAPWGEAWAKVFNETGLEAQEFCAFVRGCRLDFGVELPGGSAAEWAPAMANREVARWSEDLDALQLALVRLVADPRQIVQLSRDELLGELKWRERQEFRNRHEFPPPAIPYREITETAEDLLAALVRYPGGYLMLRGTPGSGKSTLLTETLRYRPERVVRYYAYVPDALEPNARRGEAVNFFHDVVLSLDRLGFYVGETLLRDDLDLLSSRFHLQLARLHQDYRSTGRKTVIVIDGLDHISREQSPHRSLVAELPGPAQIPEGVYLLLGSQTDQLPDLPPLVRDQLDQAGRQVEMRRLTREAVVGILADAKLRQASAGAETEKIFVLSGGHPLALAYVINQLRSAADRSVQEVLVSVEPFHERIDAQYVAHWEQVAPSRTLVRLLALLARMRGAIDISWVEQWADPEALYELNRRFRHYFRLEPDGRWYFFHNSFRVFLLQKTRSLPGVSTTTGDAGLFHELAEHCSAKGTESPQRWDELYYRAAAGEHEAVLRLATPHAFREQFLAGRSIESIQTDIRRAYPSSRAQGDLVALARLLFAAAEYVQREYNLREIPITDLLLELREARTAIDRLREGHRLRVDPGEALRASSTLDAFGMHDEAERLFALAEPLEVLGNPTPIELHQVDETVKLLETWIDAAPRFRPTEQILEVISRLQRTEEPRRNESDEDATEGMQALLRFRLVGALQSLGRWDEMSSVVSTWDPESESDWSWWFWAHVYGWREAAASGQHARAIAVFERACSGAAGCELSLTERVALGEGYWRVMGDPEGARAVLGAPHQPPLVELAAGQDGFQPFDTRFRLNRLLAALGDDRSVTELVPDPGDAHKEGLVLFERQVCVVAKLQGNAWAGNVLSAASFVLESRGILRLFSRKQEFAWRGWYLAVRARSELYRHLIRAAQLHGEEVVGTLRDTFEAEWTHPELSGYWPADIIRDVVVAFLSAGAPMKWGRAWLVRVEPGTLAGDDIEERLKSAVARFQAYLYIGDLAAARQVYRTLLMASLAIGYKDYQLLGWIRWAERANEADPARAWERIGVLARFLPATEGLHVEREAVKEVLRICCKWDLGSGIRLLEWMFDRGLIHFEHALEILLNEAFTHNPNAILTIGSIYRHVLLPFATTPSDALISTLSRAARRKGDVLTLDLLVDSVKTHALPSSRNRLLRAIAASGGQETGLSDSAISSDPIPLSREDPGSNHSDETVEIDGFSLSPADVRRRAVSVQAVRELLSRGRAGVMFRWGPVLGELVAGATREEVAELGDLFSEHDRRSEVHPLLCARLLELDDKAAAWSLAKTAFDRTRAGIWEEYYDGGARVRAIESLIAADPTRAHSLAFETLVGELSAGLASARGVAFESHRILPLLADTIPDPGIWEEVRAYVETLFTHAKDGGPSPLRPDGTDTAGGSAHASGSIAEALLTFVATYLDHPARALAHAAQRTFVDLLARNDDVAGRTMRALLSNQAEAHHALISVLVAVAEIKLTAVGPFRDQIQALTASPHFGVRRLAEALVARMSPEPEMSAQGTVADPATELDGSAGKPRTANSPLPAVYSLSFEPRGEVHRIREVSSTDFLPATNDPAELLMALRPEADLISKLAGVQPEALYHRVAQIVVGLGNSSADYGERELRTRLSAINLRIGFRRPRVLLTRKALAHAAAELVDSGRIPADACQSVDLILRSVDPTMLRMRPGPRPTWIPPIVERREDNHPRDGWAEDVSTEQSALLQPTDAVEGVVLAEETFLRWLAWGIPEERRIGARVFGTPPESILRREDPLESLCARLHHTLVAEYSTEEGDAKHLSVVQHGWKFDTPGNRWLAFNPAIARVLGWTLSPAGLFRWVDANKSLMVESIWWEDGFVEHEPPHFDDEVGSGWAVRATKVGWEQIEHLYGTRTTCVRVRREAKDQSQRETISLFAESKGEKREA